VAGRICRHIGPITGPSIGGSPMEPLRLWKRVRHAGRDGLVLLAALRDPRTPRRLKLAIAALALYAVSPIDLVPDVLAVLGWADDLVVLMLGIPWVARRLPPDVRASAQARVEGWLGGWRSFTGAARRRSR
jgi:uncharacterized membrane protein YkvA (DUF1232 family)